MNFHSDLNKALRYSMDAVDNLLSQLSSPAHIHTRAGTSRGDKTLRLVLADALQEQGREREAGHLRGDGHVMVHGGEVKPARFTLRHLHALHDRVAQELLAAGDWNTAHPIMNYGTPHQHEPHPRDFLPGAEFQDAVPLTQEPWEVEGGYNPIHDYLHDEVAEAHPERIHKDPDTGLPLIRGSCFTCHDFECPIHEAPMEWAELLNDTVFEQRNRVTRHLPQAERERIARMVTEEAGRVPVEEPVPQEEHR